MFMPSSGVIASRWAAGAGLVLVVLLSAQVVAVALAAPEQVAGGPQVVAQGVPTPTPFRFLTPTPFTMPRTTTTTTTTTAPRAGGIPVELAIPMLAGGLAAIGSGGFLLRRRR